MTHPLTRPRWIAGHLLALVTVVAFVNLGFWQLRRHDEVRDLQAMVEEAATIETRDIRRAAPYRRGFAHGAYDYDHEVRVLRSRDGVSGEVVLTPLLLDDGTAVLVERGWVHSGGSLPQSDEPVRVAGYVWPSEDGSWAPDSLVPGQVVRRIDPAILRPFVTYELLLGVYLIPGAEPPAISSGPHLSYAVQWFLFTGVVLVGYPLLLRRVLRQERLAAS